MLHLGDRGRDIDPRQVLANRGRIRRLAPDPARLTNAHGRRVAICGGQRRIAEPRIGDEASGTGGAHHVAAPQRIDAEYRGCQSFFKTHSVSSLWGTSAGPTQPSRLTEPNQRYPHNPKNNTADTVCE